MVRIEYLNTLRLFATFAVVLLHSSATYFDNGLYGHEDYYAFGFYNTINVFAVPVFVLISGSLFLNPQKYIDYTLMFRKYVKRICLALVIFGLPMCFAESFLNREDWKDAFCNFLTGHSWAHMWYLYMLIGLYLMTPILKPFVNNSSRRTFLTAISVLFVMCSIMPTMEHFGINLKSWMIISNNPYVLLYVLGFYLAYLERFTLKKWHLLLVLLACVLVISFKLIEGVDYNLYYDPVSLALAVTIFLLFKRYNFTWDIANRLNPYCFGIYLTHTVFLNALAKVLHFNPADYMSAWFSIPILALVTFGLSFLSCYLLRKIPFMKANVL